MIGVLTFKDLMVERKTIIKEFGVRFFLKCCFSCVFKPKCTFLELVFSHEEK